MKLTKQFKRNVKDENGLKVANFTYVLHFSMRTLPDSGLCRDVVLVLKFVIFNNLPLFAM